MRVIGVQLDIVWEDKPANHAKVRGILSKTKIRGGELVLLPEMFATGFTMNVGVATDSVSKQDQGFLSRTAKELGVYLMGGLVMTGKDGRGRNQAVVYGPSGQEVVRFAKLHPYTPGKEAQHYTAGETIELFDWAGVKVSPFVCYDLRFPEIFRAATRRGAEMLTVIANWPVMRVEHWVTLVRARAIENQAYVAAVNRCGKDPWLEYPGRSLIVDPKGNVVADGGSGEGLIEAEIDVEALRVYRKEFPILEDMRADFVR